MKDSFSFVKLIQKKTSRNDFMINFDVESLFTSISVHESIDLAIRAILEKKTNYPLFIKLDGKIKDNYLNYV
jgi:hypothetical protein